MAEILTRFEEGFPKAHWDWVRLHLKEIFDFEPDCLPTFYSNRFLMPWQGAATWIEERKVVSLQLRESFRQGTFWGYNRDEILAHEAVHAARSAFDEPKFEEFFAFMVSEKWWRRALGPIIQRPWEVWPFIVGVFLGLFFPAIHLITAFWVGMGSWRLMKVHYKMKRASRAIMKFIKDPKRVRAVLFRLTDREIELFSHDKNIFVYAEKQHCLRWKLIRLAYWR